MLIRSNCIVLGQYLHVFQHSYTTYIINTYYASTRKQAFINKNSKKAHINYSPKMYLVKLNDTVNVF